MHCRVSAMLPWVTVIVVSIVVVADVGALPTTSWRRRIVGGKNAVIEEYPYQVAIETEFETFICGGSILSEKVIVTAAHPFRSESREEETYVVRVGSSFPQKGGRLYNFKPDQVIIHPNYVGVEHQYDYDVALIKLHESIAFNLSADKIALIPKGAAIGDGAELVVTGYGEISFDHQLAEQLQVAVIPKQPSQVCAKLADVPLTDRMLCAGSGKPTTYHGDSGGPLTTKDRKLVGIVSWGKSEPGPTDPVVFTSIANPEIYDFITKNSS